MEAHPAYAIITDAMYEAAYYGAVKESFGANVSGQIAAGVNAVYEACKRHVGTMCKAQNNLRISAEGGNITAKRTLEDQLQAQELTHYVSAASVHDFYVLVFAYSKEEQLQFLNSMLMFEDRRLGIDRHSRSSASTGKPLQFSVRTPAPVEKVEKYESSQLKTEIQKSLKQIMMRNILEYTKDKDNEAILTRFCAHPLCPVEGLSVLEKVRIRSYQYKILIEIAQNFFSSNQVEKLKAFPDDAPGSIRYYIFGRVSLFRKRFKCVAFGPPLVRAASYKANGPLMESRNSDRGCLQSEGQRDLLARSFLEIVGFLFHK